jgi:hypothetical protein
MFFGINTGSKNNFLKCKTKTQGVLMRSYKTYENFSNEKHLINLYDFSKIK